jgi:hypothetical protein
MGWTALFVHQLHGRDPVKKLSTVAASIMIGGLGISNLPWKPQFL